VTPPGRCGLCEPIPCTAAVPVAMRLECSGLGSGVTPVGRKRHGWKDWPVTSPANNPSDMALLRRGRVLEASTLAWNVVGIAVLAVAALRARSVALVGFGLDSLIEIGASTVVLWELSGTGEDRQRRALRLIAAAFIALALYLLVQTGFVFLTEYHPQPSPLGITWTALTALAMFALALARTAPVEPWATRCSPPRAGSR
jgi:hypothetical protein